MTNAFQFEAEIPRRSFLGGMFVTCGGLFLSADAFGADAPKVRLGVISDLHISAAWNQEKYVEKALRWFDAQGVDAVMVPGDIAHAGLISELTSFAALWDKVFPRDRGRDGRPVEKLFVTGNHDMDAWWMQGDEKWRSENMLSCGDNVRKVWQKLFHEDYRPVWKKVVKGYAFIGSQWPSRGSRPAVEAWFREHAKELDPVKPFFYTQHAHPKGTCGDGKISCDDGSSMRALAPFPNAVAITGHSHQTLTDDSSVWQGAFTSINAGCLRVGENDRHDQYDSTYPFYSPKRGLNRMIPLAGEEGRCGLLVDIFDDHLVVHRRGFESDMPLGDDWRIALPAVTGGPFDPGRQHAEDVGPAFPSDAKIEAVRCSVSPEAIAGPALKGKPCVWVKMPCPCAVRPGSRVYDFRVEMLVDGHPKVSRLVLANGYNVPESLANRISNCLFGTEEIPESGKVCFRVTPRTSFGTTGRSLLSDSL